eukprot:TRINITY_DN95_c0_g3_i1.p1 TRINITY_DN95_c0_g3~~TRINITY_DN95_c0_g3_i1.p1  ORF type:complete len:208 (-),score=-30.54 TRINITY_DN95_c0_g3_i1:1068-1691(-)
MFSQTKVLFHLFQCCLYDSNFEIIIIILLWKKNDHCYNNNQKESLFLRSNKFFYYRRQQKNLFRVATQHQMHNFVFYYQKIKLIRFYFIFYYICKFLIMTLINILLILFKSFRLLLVQIKNSSKFEQDLRIKFYTNFILRSQIPKTYYYFNFFEASIVLLFFQLRILLIFYSIKLQIFSIIFHYFYIYFLDIEHLLICCSSDQFHRR